MTTIRPLTVQDVPAYMRLRLEGLERHPEAFGETPEHFKSISSEAHSARLVASAAHGACILGAFSEHGDLQGVVGLACGNSGEKTAHRAMLWGMYVDSASRGKGLGRKLINACLQKAEGIAGLTQVQLSVVTENKAAVSLYKAAGFEVYGTDPQVLQVGGRFYDEYLMVKHLR